jgi:2'-5' RNA ligase
MSRLFVGIFLPDELKESISEIQDSITKMPMRAKLVEPENLHLTVTFLGETPDEKIDEISKKLGSVCSRYKSFTAKIGGVMLIPNENYIRVIALDVKSNNDVLENLRKDIVREIGGDSYPVHLTLARVREVADKNFVRENSKSLNVEKFFSVDSVHLIKSTVSRRGPVYESIHESELA